MEEQSRLRGENARTKEEIGRIDALSARARSAISPSRSSFGGGVSGIGNGISEEEQEILDQYATIDNFESPQFKNIPGTESGAVPGKSRKDQGERCDKRGRHHGRDDLWNNGRDGHDRIQFSVSKDADDSHRRRNGRKCRRCFRRSSGRTGV